MNGRLIAVGAAVAGAVFLILKKILLDEREPIRIRNKKLSFELMTKEWKKADPSGTRWRIVDPEGDPVASFDVEARRPKGQIPFSAGTVTFKVNVHGQTKEYVLTLAESKGSSEPELLSPPHLEHPAGNKKVLRIENDPDVWISEVQGDGHTKYTFTNATGPIDIRVKPRR